MRKSNNKVELYQLVPARTFRGKSRPDKQYVLRIKEIEMWSKDGQRFVNKSPINMLNKNTEVMVYARDTLGTETFYLLKNDVAVKRVKPCKANSLHKIHSVLFTNVTKGMTKIERELLDTVSTSLRVTNPHVIE